MTADHGHRLPPDGNEIFSLQPEESQLVRVYRLNTLFIGPNHATLPLVSTLRHDLRESVIEIRSREPLILPHPERVRTLILHDIATLRPTDQRKLMTWLDGAAGRTLVLSTASAPILPMIVAGGFIEPLYYRLNTLYVELTTVESDSG